MSEMTMEEAVKALGNMRDDFRVLAAPREGEDYDFANDNAKRDADALDYALAALRQQAGQAEPVAKPAECANGCPPQTVCDWCQSPTVWLRDGHDDVRLLTFAWARSPFSTGQMATAYQCIVAAAKECGQTVTAPPRARVTREAIEALVAGPYMYHHKMNDLQEAQAKGFDRCREMTLQNIAEFFQRRSLGLNVEVSDD